MAQQQINFVSTATKNVTGYATIITCVSVHVSDKGEKNRLFSTKMICLGNNDYYFEWFCRFRFFQAKIFCHLKRKQ